EAGDAYDFGCAEWFWIVTAKEIDVFANAKSFRHARDLKHCANACPRRRISRIAAEHTNAAGGWRNQSQQETDCCGLAGSIGAQQRDDFARANLEGELVERDGRSVRFRDGMQPRNGSATGWEELKAIAESFRG